jgi:hypothetical protein
MDCCSRCSLTGVHALQECLWSALAKLVIACQQPSSVPYLGRHAVVRVLTEDASIRAATVLVVPAVATSIVGEWHDRRFRRTPVLGAVFL